MTGLLVLPGRTPPFGTVRCGLQNSPLRTSSPQAQSSSGIAPSSAVLMNRFPVLYRHETSTDLVPPSDPISLGEKLMG